MFRLHIKSLAVHVLLLSRATTSINPIFKKCVLNKYAVFFVLIKIYNKYRIECCSQQHINNGLYEQTFFFYFYQDSASPV